MAASVEDLLQQNSGTLWRAQEQARVASPANAGLPTGYAALDHCLPGGGWPRRGSSKSLPTSAASANCGC